MNFAIVLPIAALIFVVVVVLLSVRIVSQTDNILVERIGKYHRTLKPGLNFMIPIIDRPVATTSTKDTILSLGKVDAISKDNAVVLADALIVVRVTDPEKAIYGVDNYYNSTAMLAAAALRSKLGQLDLDEALSSREQIKIAVQDSIRNELEDWGLNLRNVEIQEITPSESMLKAMELQAAAERERKATVARASGDKDAAQLRADGERYAAEKEGQGRHEAAMHDAKAQIELANATAKAVETVGTALKANPEAANYLLGEKFIENYGKLAVSENAKVVAMPTDFMAGVTALLTAATPAK